jgi:hypothetical protein
MNAKLHLRIRTISDYYAHLVKTFHTTNVVESETLQLFAITYNYFAVTTICNYVQLFYTNNYYSYYNNLCHFCFLQT